MRPRSSCTGRRPPPGGHAGIPWGKILLSGNLWVLCLMYFCAAYAWYFNINYLHIFLQEQYDVPRDSALGAIYKGGPLWMGAMACLAGGFLSDLFTTCRGGWLTIPVGIPGACYTLCFDG